jgi:hypothetical protein
MAIDQPPGRASAARSSRARQIASSRERDDVALAMGAAQAGDRGALVAEIDVALEEGARHVADQQAAVGPY